MGRETPADEDALPDSESGGSDGLPRNAARGTPQGEHSSNGVHDLAELRRLLVGPEQRSISRLEDELGAREVGAAEVSDVLPEAIKMRAADGRLAKALAPTIEGAIETSVRKNPKPLTDAIFPVIGPAIRKAIQSALAGAVESFNRTLENSLSVKSMRWRVEAWRTGKPFGEVVLLHSLVYRVEQVFLIHAESGVLIRHVSSPTVAARDAEMVSAMLSAIGDFVRDSFDVEAGDELQNIEVAGAQIEIARGPQAILAAVVRGVPPRALRDKLASTLESIHLEHAEALVEFDGDDTPFVGTDERLEECLEERRREGQARRRKGIGFVLPVLALLLTAFAIRWYWTSAQRERAFAEWVERLDSEPGIVVVSAEGRGDGYRLSGWRDPLARDPAELLIGDRVQPDDVEAVWEPFHSPDAPLALARARAVLEPPATVALALRDGVLAVEGRASAAWIARVRRTAGSIAGVDAVDVEDVEDVDLEALHVRVREVEGTVLSYREGRVELGSEAVERVVGRLSALEDAAARAARLVRVDLIVSAESSAVAYALGEPLRVHLQGAVALRSTWLRVEPVVTSSSGAGGVRIVPVVLDPLEGER